MGTYIVKMPDIGEGIAEVELVAWNVKPGDVVNEDQCLAEVMTDKATVEIPSPVAGTIVALGGEIGQLMAVGSELIRLEVAGAGPVKAPAPDRPNASVQKERPSPPEDPMNAPLPAPAARQPARAERAPDVVATDARRAAPPPAEPGPRGKPLASPAVRQRAGQLAIDLQFVHGSGPDGRISHQDLDVYLTARGQPLAALGARTAGAERHDEQAVPVVGLRRRIAQKMAESKRRIPHFSYVEEVDVTALEVLREQLNQRYAEQRGKLTLLPLIARALVLAVRDFPRLNARFDDEAGMVTQHGAVHLGIAAQTDFGLMVPVVRHAESRDVWGLGQEITRMADAARRGRATRDELSGSTLTLSSLGPLGGIVSTPIINHPEVAIVGVNRIVDRLALQGGAVVTRRVMNLSSSFDHRVIDGMDAARFIQAVRTTLEAPSLLLVE